MVAPARTVDIPDKLAPWWRPSVHSLKEWVLTGWRGGTGLPHQQVRLRTLVLARWLAVTGQTAAVLFVHFGLGFNLPVWPCFAMIVASVLFNIGLQIQFPFNKRISVGHATFQSAFDVTQLAGLLTLTGGLSNPFTLLLLAPITISATLLNLRSTVFLGLLGIGLITGMVFFHLPLPWYDGQSLTLAPVYLTGLWIAMGLGILFNTAYAWRVSVEADRMRAALAATQQVLSREQRLAALGGLAAAAAHELGTPLATIALTAKELSRDLPEDSPLFEDVSLLRGQAERCREILSRLSRDPGDGDAVMHDMALGVLLDEVAGPHRDFGVDITISLVAQTDPPSQAPVVIRRPEILYGLGNIVENAVDFARERVAITARWTDTALTVEVCDDGPGFAAEVVDRLGEPYVTTRRPAEAGDLALNPDSLEPEPSGDGEGQHGMGLGFFIAKTLIERSGGRVDVANRTASGSTAGARVTVQWPLNRIAVSQDGLATKSAELA